MQKREHLSVNGTSMFRRRRCWLCLFGVGACFFMIYMVYFRHPPPEEIIRMNSQNFDMDSSIAFKTKNKDKAKSESRKKTKTNSVPKGKSQDIGGTSSEVLGSSSETLKAKQKKNKQLWNSYLKKENLVSIGDVYTSCDKETRLLIGKVVLTEDKVNGGVKTRTYMNFTLAKNLTEGEFYMDVKYNDKDLYDNHWDLCEMADEEDVDETEKFLACPLSKGFHHFAQERHIPSFLPKGKYETSVWITDDQEETILCGKCIFVL